MGERYYVADDKGIATCFAAATGKLLWRKRLEGRFTASPLAAAGKLFFTSESGTTLVVDATQQVGRRAAERRASAIEPSFRSRLR